MTFCSCSLKVKSQTKDFWSISTICLLQVKLLSYIHLMRKKKLLTLLEIKLRVKEKSILEIILTAGTGILTKLNKNYTCHFASRLSVKVSEEELGSSLHL